MTADNSRPDLGTPNPRDVFISPHSDDVCFSLACFAHQRQAGRLLNVFSISPYTADPRQAYAENVRSVTRQRLSEDALFAQACGLTLENLEFKDAMARNQAAFQAQGNAAVPNMIDKRLMGALVGPLLGMANNPKPWLFAPMGIGRHVDHLAVVIVILRNIKLLAKNYHIAFYEDLFYASHAPEREKAITALTATLKQATPKRCRLGLDRDQQAQKMKLIQLYSSQLKDHLNAIQAFTPADTLAATPHEALWVLQEA